MGGNSGERLGSPRYIGTRLASGGSSHRYCYKGREEFNEHHPRSWKFQGSNNATTWIDLDIQTGNLTINKNTWFTKEVTPQVVGYRYFRFLQTGTNSSGELYLTGGEIELYGTLIIKG